MAHPAGAFALSLISFIGWSTNAVGLTLVAPVSPMMPSTDYFVSFHQARAPPFLLISIISNYNRFEQNMNRGRLRGLHSLIHFSYFQQVEDIETRLL
jgi:hypothetical protein